MAVTTPMKCSGKHLASLLLPIGSFSLRLVEEPPLDAVVVVHVALLHTQTKIPSPSTKGGTSEIVREMVSASQSTGLFVNPIIIISVGILALRFEIVFKV